MSLLPDIGPDGRLIPEKKQYVMPRTRKKQQSFLNWENLRLNLCPSCGEFFPKETGDRTCTNHNGAPFKVSEFRLAQIIRDMDQRDSERFPRF